MTENNSTDDITIKKQNKNKILLSVCVNAFLVLSLLFFAPLEIYLGNIAEFNFSFFQTWFMLLAASLIIIIFLVLIESILPKILFKLANLTAFALGLCCYIQAMFLNGKMSSLTGETYSFEQNLIVRNLALWIAIFAIIYIAYFILSKFKKKNHSAQLDPIRIVGFGAHANSRFHKLGSNDRYFKFHKNGLLDYRREIRTFG